MAKEIVVIPAFRRPEFLHLCLERIVAAEDRACVKVLIVVDRHCDQAPDYQNFDVAERFKRTLKIRAVLRTEHWYSGNSANVLLSLKQALDEWPRLIYLVEEDVLIGKDFFRWHRAAQALGNWFCSIAVKNTREPKLKLSDDSSRVYTSKEDYCSLGVCFRSQSVERIVAHATPEYFSDMRGYIEKNFGGIGAREFHEQDGLVARVMLQTGESSIFPHVPRAFHAGFYGYHRKADWNGSGESFESRLNRLRSIVHDREKMISAAPEWDDIYPCSLDAPPWESLELSEAV